MLNPQAYGNVDMSKVAMHLRKAVATDGFFLLFVAAYVFCTFCFTQYHGLNDRFSIFMYVTPALLQYIPVGMLFYAIYIFYVMVKVRPNYLFLYLWLQLRAWLISYTFVRGCLNYVAICVFLSAMTSFKSLIPEINPFNWDPELANFDRILHGGFVPWEIIQPVFGLPFISHAIDIIYRLWFIVMMVAIVWFIFVSKDERLRKQFMITYVMAWAINGTILALFFSSVGPAFFSNIYPEVNNPYQGLMTYLNTANNSYPLMAIDAQKMLWQLYESEKLGTAGGISSMPSMHVSIAFLIFLVSLRTQFITAKLLGGTFLLLILIGSVHLGWHYAIDGYLSIISTAFIWRFNAYLVPTSNHQYDLPNKAENYSTC
ncbi:MAG: hypothetical protein ACJAYF_003077 [Arenicella sp.]